MKNAEFSPCRLYRYTLWREWLFGSGYVNFICLNPSTADEFRNDNTITKCIKYAKRWGYQRMCVTNLFAYRATNRKEMLSHPSPIGIENDQWITAVANEANLVVAAWSQDGNHLSRSEHVLTLLPKTIHILRMGAKEPWHPLYLPDTLDPMVWGR